MSNTIQSLSALAGSGPVRDSQTADRRDPASKISSGERTDVSSQREALAGLSDRIESAGRTAEFSYDQNLNRVVIRIYSQAGEPREVVRQIPPEEYLTFASQFREMLGLLFDEKA